MKIKQKVTLTIIVIAITLLGAVGVLSKAFINKNIERAERDKARASLENVVEIFEENLSSVVATCSDWANWNDTYEFIEGKNNSYIHDYVNSLNFSNLKMHVVIFINKEGNIVYDKTFSDDYKVKIDTPKELKNNIYFGSNILNHKSIANKISGIIILDGRPLMLSAVPVTNSMGDSNGVLIMGRFLLSDYKNWVESVTDSKISIRNDISSKNEVTLFKINNITYMNSDVRSEEISDSAKILDVESRDSLYITASIPRDMYKQSLYNLNIFRHIFVFIFIIVIIVTVILFQKVLLSRIYELYEFIKNISTLDDMQTRITIKGRDELTSLGNAINLMLNKLEGSNKKVLENEERLRFVLEGTNEGFWDLNIGWDEIFISSHISRILEIGNSDTNLKIQQLKNVLSTSYLRQFYRKYIKAIKANSNEVFEVEHKLTLKNSKEKWLLIKGRIVVRDSSNNPIRMSGTITDITEKKTSEETIRYLSSNDVLTGVYNRAEFNKASIELDKPESLPLSLIMCDVNGLKIANDAFGHKAGDKLLVKIAEILKKASNGKGIVSRIGGDEFAILLPNINKKEAEVIGDKITRYCNEAEANPIKPSIAIGTVTKLSENEDINKLFDKAEDKMYRNKLLQDKSVRHSIIASLERSLQETDFETREHTARLQSLAITLGKSIGLPKDKLDELSVLGSLHDIGKIAIPKAILTKPEALNSEEWEIIKKHCEIGYRIALSSVELIPIAECILTHHEKWDGSGYPKGLKGEEIPILARIISIVDAYDVITNSRPYKKPATHEEAIAEINRCSGKYFDPTLAEEFVKIFKDSKKIS